MDKNLIAERFGKATDTYTHEASVQRQIASKMIGLLAKHLPTGSCKSAVEFGCGTGTYSRLLLHTLQPQQLLLNDISARMQRCCQELLNERVSFLSGDAETLPFPKETELITSCSTLQWFEQPETFFHRCNNYLAHQGYFAFSTFGQQNMKEIRQLTGSGLPYRSLEELKTSLATIYDIVHAEEELISLSFDAPMQVLYHLKRTGVTGTTQHCWTRKNLQEFCTQYVQHFGSSTNVSLTYHPIYIIVRKR